MSNVDLTMFNRAIAALANIDEDFVSVDSISIVGERAVVRGRRRNFGRVYLVDTDDSLREIIGGWGMSDEQVINSI